MATTNIKVLDKDYEINSNGFYPYILFKRTTGKNFEPSDDYEELVTMIWCYLKANKDFDMELEDFIRISTLDMATSYTVLNQKVIEENDGEKKVM